MPQNRAWARAGVEPSLADMLADPIVQALMQADGVYAGDLMMIIRHLKQSGHAFSASGPVLQGPDTSLIDMLRSLDLDIVPASDD